MDQPSLPALGLTPDQVADLLGCGGPRAVAAQQPAVAVPRRNRSVIELWADPERALPAADPAGREQRLACGAALFNLRLALQGCGIRPLVTLSGDPERPDLLACVRYGGAQAAHARPARAAGRGTEAAHEP